MPDLQPSSFTISMKHFDQQGLLPGVETFFAINHHTVFFNQNIVESTSILGLDQRQAEVLLHLKDGSTIQKHFAIDEHGVIERQVETTRH